MLLFFDNFSSFPDSKDFISNEYVELASIPKMMLESPATFETAWMISSVSEKPLSVWAELI